MFKKEISVLIPSYNEENAIASVIQSLNQTLSTTGWLYEIIVVNDGSKDQTSQMAKEAGARVIDHPTNAGYGAALQTGIQNAKYEWVGTIDADASYAAEDIQKLMEVLPGFDMVIGMRQGKHYWGNLIKHPARLVFRAIAQFVVGEKIPDTNSGLRIFSRAIALDMLPRLCYGFSFSTTITLSFMSTHRFVKFIPISYNPRVGSSKVRYIRDTLRTLQLMLETIVYYNPLKAGILLSLFPGTIGLASLVVSIVLEDQDWFFFSIQLFCWSFLFLGIGFVLLVASQLLLSHPRNDRT